MQKYIRRYLVDRIDRLREYPAADRWNGSVLLLIICLLLFGLTDLVTKSDSLAAATDVDGLVVWLKLDETSGTQASDSSGNQNDGLLVGGPTWVSGQIDGAIALDNTDLNGNQDWIEIPPDESQNMGQTLTLAAWVNAERFRNGDGIITKGQNITSYAMRLGGDGRVMFTANFGEPFGFVGSGDWFSAGSISANQWHHVAVSYDGSTIRFYIDGVKDTTEVPVELLFGRATQPLHIGADLPDDNQYFDGRVDDVRVYNRALSATEIAGLATVENAPPNVESPPDQTSTPGTIVVLDISASDPNNDTLAYTAIGLPPGLSINSSSGRISGVIGQNSIGTYQVVLTVDDGQNRVLRDFTWRVVNPTATPINTPTNTPTDPALTATHTPTNRPTHTPTHTPTEPPTQIPSPSATLTALPTDVPPTNEATATPTNTDLPSSTSTPTNTPTITISPTTEPSTTPSLTPIPEATATATATPGGKNSTLRSSQIYLQLDGTDPNQSLTAGEIILFQTTIVNEGSEGLSRLWISQTANEQLTFVPNSFWIIRDQTSSGTQIPGESLPIQVDSIDTGEEIMVAYRMKINSVEADEPVEIRTQAQIDIEGYRPTYSAELTLMVENVDGQSGNLDGDIYLPIMQQ